MPPPFVRHVFICTNERDPSNPKGCCLHKGSAQLVQEMKKLVFQRGLKGQVRAQASGCLDSCERGASIVVYPEGVWYQKVTLDDIAEIVDEHLVNGRPVQRLRFDVDES